MIDRRDDKRSEETRLSVEQDIRDMLERAGVTEPDPQTLTTGNLVELSNRLRGITPRRSVDLPIPLDPVSAIALAVKAVAEMITEIIKGQPEDVKIQAWDWYMKDVAKWRKILKVDE